MRIGEIEKRILEINSEIACKPEELVKRYADVGVTQPQLERLVAKEAKPLNDELTQLEIERRFILDRRNNLFWRVAWSVVVPVGVSVISTYIISKYM